LTATLIDMNLLCVVAGHRWRVGESSTNEETDLRCTRCGKQHVAAPGTPGGYVNRSGSFPDASAMSIAQDLHRNEPDG
jgi:hypothetical protein